jgi:branched-subunit amino acid transport protein
LKAYFEFRKAKGISSSFILLDEITFPTEWFRTIKYYVDMGLFSACLLPTFLMTDLTFHLGWLKNENRQCSPAA